MTKTVEFKYDIGDEVYAVHDNLIFPVTIKDAHLVSMEQEKIMYSVRVITEAQLNFDASENSVFKSIKAAEININEIKEKYRKVRIV